MVHVRMWDTLPSRNGSVCTILTLSYHMILCSALVITYHAKIKKNRPWPAADRIRNISANTASFFDPRQAPLSLWPCAYDVMLRSIWEGKTTEFSFPRDHGLRFQTSPNSDDPGRRAGPFLTLPTLVSHSFHLSWRWEEVGVFIGQKTVGSFVLFHFSCRTCMTHLFHAIFPKSAVNMQQSTFNLWKW